MAKKKETSIKNWIEVNEKMKNLAEKKANLLKLEGDLTIEVNKLKEIYSQKAKGLNESIATIEADIELFCEDNKSEFLNQRTKRMDFGSISYRLVESIKIKNIKSTINALKSLKMFDCLTIKENPNKEKMQELDDSILLKIGAKREKKDKINIEPNLEKIGG